MRTAILTLVFGLWANSAWAVCAMLTQDAVEACLDFGAGPGCVQYSALASGNSTKKAADLQTRLQDIVDFKQALNSLTLDDPDRTTDPDQTNFFHGTLDGEKKTELTPLSESYLISRCAVIGVTDIANNGDMLDFQIRVSNP